MQSERDFAIDLKGRAFRRAESLLFYNTAGLKPRRFKTTFAFQGVLPAFQASLARLGGIPKD